MFWDFGRTELGGWWFVSARIGRLLDQCSDQPQQLHVLRPVASFTKECADFNVGRPSARRHVRDVPDQNAPGIKFTSEQPFIAVRAAVKFSGFEAHSQRLVLTRR